MRVSWHEIRLLYLRELRSALRETSIVVTSIAVPLLMYPVLIWLSSSISMHTAGLDEKVQLRVAIGVLPQRWESLQRQIESDPRVLVTRLAGDPREALAQTGVDAILEVVSGDPPLARVVFSSARPRSDAAAGRVDAHLTAWRDLQLEQAARAGGMSDGDLQICRVDTIDQTPEKRGALALSLLFPCFTVVVVVLGALYPAVDTTAGEYERSTIETIMVAAVSRVDIVVAKYLYVVTMAAGSGFLNIGAILLCFGPLLGDAAPPLSALLVVIPGIIVLAAFVSAGLMLSASFARTLQQGQSMATPFFLLVSTPSILAAVPDTPFSLSLAFVPVVNVTFVFREAIAGRFPLAEIGVSLGVTLFCVAMSLFVASRVLGRHELAARS